jgi:hypothetical protein
MREKGCLPAPWVPSWDPFYGIDLFLLNMRCLKEHTILEKTNRRFQDSKFKTYQLVVLGRHLHQTIEPENLKTIQAIDFKKWSLGDRRKVAFHPLLGEGIFTTGTYISSDKMRIKHLINNHRRGRMAALPRDAST